MTREERTLLLREEIEAIDNRISSAQREIAELQRIVVMKRAMLREIERPRGKGE